jgi:hypothetical protein
MQTTIRVTTALAAAGFIAALAACDRQPHASASTTPQPSEQTVNVQPAPPTGDPPGTTAVDGKQSDVSKEAESTQKPQEGDNHSYSTVAPSSPQKAGGTDGKQAPDGKQQ